MGCGVDGGGGVVGVAGGGVYAPLFDVVSEVYLLDGDGVGVGVEGREVGADFLGEVVGDEGADLVLVGGVCVCGP